MNEITEKFNVVWMWNHKIYERICNSLDEAERVRNRILKAKGWSYDDVSIHLIQINRYGDKTIV